MIVELRTYGTLELVTGVILIVAGLIVYWWGNGLYWIATYPPALEKQVLDAFPCVAWLIGAALIFDSLGRHLKRAKQN